jgi:glycerophosphoryl diester phosphodiesterase
MLRSASIIALIAGGLATSAIAQPIVIGHRGASGYRPEHTLASYELAIDMGADYVEPDLVMTLDGVLVCRHENEIGGTTNVASHPEFAARQTTKVIDGVNTTGWFTEDFTLAELKTLRAKERIPGIRPQNTQYDGLFEVPTFQEMVNLVRAKEAQTGRTIGIYPEIKHSTFQHALGLDPEQALVTALNANGYTGPDAPVFIQSFEVGNLQRLNTMTDVPLVQLLNFGGQPYDFTAAGNPMTYADLATSAGLDFINDYADAVGANKFYVIPRDAQGNLLVPTDFVDNAHMMDLMVHIWTMRSENVFLPTNFQDDPLGEFRAYILAGIDGFFTDQPDIGRLAVPTPGAVGLVALGGLAAARRRRAR